MRIVIYGAGAVGATIGARLHQAGAEVALIARGEHLRVMQQQGLHFVAPDGEYQLTIPCAGHPGELTWSESDVVLLCVKSQHTSDALDALRDCAPDYVPVVCTQNGVANERLVLRRRGCAYGMVVNLPALHLQPGEVITHAGGCGGILDLGRYPSGSDDTAEQVAARLTSAGFAARADSTIMRWKYAKLLRNLGNALQAAVTTVDADPQAPPDPAVVEVGRILRREALACFAAAGIDCADREQLRERQAGVYHMVDIPGWPRVGGSSWQSVQRGTGDIETDYLNGEIVLLGGLHGIPTPANRVCQQLAVRMIRERLPVGSFSPAQVLELIEAAALG